MPRLIGGERGPGAMVVDREKEIENVSIVEDLGIWPETVRQGDQWTRMGELYRDKRKERWRS